MQNIILKKERNTEKGSKKLKSIGYEPQIKTINLIVGGGGASSINSNCKNVFTTND
jgi:hypothetical protein